MIPCSLDCIHQTEGYCILTGGATVTSTTSKCPHFEGRRAAHKSSNDQFNRLSHGADIDKLNSIGNGGTH